MESTTAFIDSYQKLKILHELAEVVSDHIADMGADETEIIRAGITIDRMVDGGIYAASLLEELSKEGGGDLPVAHEILEKYCRVYSKKLIFGGDEEFRSAFRQITGEPYSIEDVNLYCDGAFIVAECMIRHHDTGYWF